VPISRFARSLNPVRALLRLLPPTLVVRVLRGPLRGAKWIVGSAPHGAWLGRLEAPVLRRFATLLHPDDVVWDIGAHVGLYTIAAARRARHVVAFEPLPQNIAMLRRHVALNRLTNVTMVEAAVGSHDGTSRLVLGSSPSEARVASNGSITVAAWSLDTWLANTGAPPPDVVKIDVEGAELDVLQGGTRSLAERPAIVLAIHDPDIAAQCMAWLQARGYTVTGPHGEPPEGSPEWLALPQRV
jgi:FkbM family methyltransferase